MDELDRESSDANRDPITGAPGSHPVGTGVGAAAGGIAGAVAGTVVAGPVGTVVGAAVGAIAGGLTGKGVAEMVDPTVEDTYWRESYRTQPYYKDGRDYDFYAPAYRTGYEGRARYDGKKFAEVESDLEADYRRINGNAAAKWDEVRDASRAAWERIDRRARDASRT